jgi:hypothetical protein
MPNPKPNHRGRAAAKVHLTPEERAARWAAHRNAIAARKAAAPTHARLTPKAWASKSEAMTAHKLERARRRSAG